MALDLSQQMLPIYTRYTELYPHATMADFADWVQTTCGEKVSEIVDFEAAEILMEQLGIDPETVESIWEGMDSGP